MTADIDFFSQNYDRIAKSLEHKAKSKKSGLTAIGAGVTTGLFTLAAVKGHAPLIASIGAGLSGLRVIVSGLACYGHYQNFKDTHSSLLAEQKDFVDKNGPNP